MDKSIFKKSMDKTEFNCEICHKIFAKKKYLQKHVATVHEGKSTFTTNTCEICHKIYAERRYLLKHIASVHEGNKSTPKNKVIESNHNGKKLLKCNHCNSSFSKAKKLKRHVESVHEGKKSFQCTICNDQFSKKGNLQKHIAADHLKYVLENSQNIYTKTVPFELRN